MPNRELDFSNKRIADLAAEKKVYFKYDQGGKRSVPGLCIRISPTGIKSFQLYKKHKGDPIRVTLGRYPDISVDQARKLAEKKKADLLNGIDPNDKNKEKLTLQQAFDDYMQGRKCADNTRKNYESVMRIYFADWLNKPMKDITRRMVEAHYTKSCQYSESGASKAMRVLRAVFNYTMDSHPDQSGVPFLEDNPVKELKRKQAWRKELPRSRIIETEQLSSWFQAVSTLDPVIRGYLVTVLLTGLRRREASSLEWDQVNFQQRTLTVTDTKNGDPLTIPISEYLLDILKASKEQSVNQWVFPSINSKSGHIEEPKTAIKRVYEISGIQVSIHDLRRTFSTIGANHAEISPYALKALLNHRQSADVTSTHYVKLEMEMLRKATQRITDYIVSAAGLTENETVTKLKRPEPVRHH